MINMNKPIVLLISAKAEHGKDSFADAFIEEAQNKLGLSCGTICKVCKGINKTAGGFKWRYAEE